MAGKKKEERENSIVFEKPKKKNPLEKKVKGKRLAIEKQKKIYKFMALGYTHSMIADMLDIHPKTVWNYAKRYYDDRANAFKEKGIADTILSSFITQTEARMKRFLASVYNTGLKEKDRQSALNSLREEQKEYIKLCERINVIPKDVGMSLNIQNNLETGDSTSDSKKPSKIEVNIVYPDGFHDWKNKREKEKEAIEGEIIPKNGNQKERNNGNPE